MAETTDAAKKPALHHALVKAMSCLTLHHPAGAQAIVVEAEALLKKAM